MPILPPSLSRSSRTRHVLACALLALCLPGRLCAADKADIWKLLDSNQGQQAYDQARQSLSTDDPDRDLLVGIAAAQTGRGEEGVTLLKRHLAGHPEHPQNPRARLELGRSYYQIAQLDAAQTEFESVLDTDPPVQVADNVRQALSVIQAEREGQRPKFAAFIEMGLGYDTNINAGVKDALVNLPVFGEIQLNQGSTETEAGIGTLAGGADVNYALRRDLSLFGSARVDGRFHNNHSDLDQIGFTLSGGAGWMADKDQLRGSLLWNGMQLDYQTYRHLIAANGEWSRSLDALTSVGAFGQVGKIDFSGNNTLRNASLYGLGASVTRGFDGETKPVLRLSASYTIEDNLKSRDDLGRDLLGARVEMELRPGQKCSVNAGLNWQQARHRADDPLFGMRRKDTYYALDLGTGYQLSDTWAARAELQYARNDSNLALYEYDRTSVMLKLRWDFR